MRGLLLLAQAVLLLACASVGACQTSARGAASEDQASSSSVETAYTDADMSALMRFYAFCQTETPDGEVLTIALGARTEIEPGVDNYLTDTPFAPVTITKVTIWWPAKSACDAEEKKRLAGVALRCLKSGRYDINVGVDPKSYAVSRHAYRLACSLYGARCWGPPTGGDNSSSTTATHLAQNRRKPRELIPQDVLRNQEVLDALAKSDEASSPPLGIHFEYEIENTINFY